MADTTSEIMPKTTAAKSRGYLHILVISMIIASLVGGGLGFSFGKKSLEGVNSVPLGSRKVIPKISTPKSALPKTYSQLFG